MRVRVVYVCVCVCVCGVCVVTNVNLNFLAYVRDKSKIIAACMTIGEFSVALDFVNTTASMLKLQQHLISGKSVSKFQFQLFNLIL